MLRPLQRCNLRGVLSYGDSFTTDPRFVFNTSIPDFVPLHAGSIPQPFEQTVVVYFFLEVLAYKYAFIALFVSIELTSFYA